MSRALFMAKLEEGLAGLPQPEIDEIISDYGFHFAEAEAAGQSQDDIVARLGDPARLARELRGDVEQRLSREEQASPPHTMPPSAKPASGARNPGILLALVLVIGAGAAAYYFAGHDGSNVAPDPFASATPLPAPPQPAAAAQGAKVAISGGQVLDLGTITQERIEIVLDGGGHATAKGRVKELTLHIDGSGSAALGALQADIAHVDITGTGDAEISGSQLVDVTLLGTGTVRLASKPRTLKQSITGSGKVIPPG